MCGSFHQDLVYSLLTVIEQVGGAGGSGGEGGGEGEGVHSCM